MKITFGGTGFSLAKILIHVPLLEYGLIFSLVQSCVSHFILGHLENIHAETCTDFIVLLVEIFGDNPGKDLLTGVCIDRACDVHPYVKRLGKEGHEVGYKVL